jgi:ATP-dependent Zn protease
MSSDTDKPQREAGAERGGFFQRWPWKLGRLLQNVLLVVIVLWGLWLVIPALIGFFTGPGFFPIILQMLLLAGYLFLFISIQLFLIYFVLARTRIYWIMPDRAKVWFRDYRGNSSALEAASHTVTLIQGVRQIKRGGSRYLRGLLLTGPPGAGKRYLAQAIAAEAGVPLGYLNATSMAVSRIGLGQIKVAMLYRKARKMAREYGACILLIDQIEAIAGVEGAAVTADSQQQRGTRRSPRTGTEGITASAQRSVLNELVLQVDPPLPQRHWWHGFLKRLGVDMQGGKLPAVLTIATTCRIEALDDALLRVGRFDQRIAINLPDDEGRRDIIRYYLAKVRHEPLSADRMATDMAGYPPAIIKQVIHDAVIYAHVAGRQAITYRDIIRACEAHAWGGSTALPELPRMSRLPYEERRRVAYYRAGRAYMTCVAHQSASANGSNGRRNATEAARAIVRAPHTLTALTKDELLHALQIALAGRVAEETLLDIQTSRAADDLQTATHLAARLVGGLGMGGRLAVYPAAVREDWQQALLNEDLRTQTEALLQEQYTHVQALLAYNRSAITMLAEALILQGDMTDRDMDKMLTHIESRYPFAAADDTPASLAGLAARRAPPRSEDEGDVSNEGNGSSGRRFVEPEPALPDAITPDELSRPGPEPEPEPEPEPRPDDTDSNQP